LYRSLGRVVELEELVALGREGLWTAANRYDKERGVSFQTFASYRVRGAMLDGLRQLSRLPRHTHERLRVSEAALHYAEGAAEDTLEKFRGASRERAELLLGDHLSGMATAMAL